MKEPDIDEYHNDFLNNMVEYNIDMNKNHFVVFYDLIYLMISDQ